MGADSISDSAFAALDVQGYVVYRGISLEEAEAWRADVRKIAGEHGWRIRSGYATEDGAVWAVRLDWTPQDPEASEELMRRVWEDIGPER